VSPRAAAWPSTKCGRHHLPCIYTITCITYAQDTNSKCSTYKASHSHISIFLSNHLSFSIRPGHTTTSVPRCHLADLAPLEMATTGRTGVTSNRNSLFTTPAIRLHVYHASYTPKINPDWQAYKSPFSSPFISISNQSSFSLQTCSHHNFKPSSSFGRSTSANLLACIRNLYPARARSGHESCSSSDGARYISDPGDEYKKVKSYRY
jgi:hypothetical protein